MIYSEIGNTGIKIPPVIFGTSALGNLYKDLSEETKLAIVRESLHHMDGPAVFDTAGKYGAGLALEKLGEKLGLLNAAPDKVIISNKLGWLRTTLDGNEPDFEKGVWVNITHNAELSVSYEGIIKCWNQGNKLLGNNYRPKLVSIHDPDEYLASDIHNKEELESNILEGYEALKDLKKDGHVKAIGVGAKNWKIIRMLAQKIEFDWVMFANSLTIYSHPRELLDFMSELQRSGVFIINSAVFNAGFLTGGDYFDYRYIDRNNPQNDKLLQWRKSFSDICNKFSVMPARACIHFGRSHPGIKAVALNTSNPARVRNNIEDIQYDVPGEFYEALKKGGLIDGKYPYV